MNTVQYKEKKKRRIKKRILKKKGKKKVYRKARIKKSTKIFLILMCAYFVYKYISLEMQYKNLVQQKEELKIQIQSAEEDQENLLWQIENNQSQEHIESLARRYLGLVYPDEKIFKVIEEDNDEHKE